MLGTSFEFLTTRKVISGRKQFRNTHDLEKSDFFAEIFFSTFLMIVSAIFLKKKSKNIFFFEIESELSKTRFKPKIFLVSLRYLSNDFWPYLKRTTLGDRHYFSSIRPTKPASPVLSALCWLSLSTWNHGVFKFPTLAPKILLWIWNGKQKGLRRRRSRIFFSKCWAMQIFLDFSTTLQGKSLTIWEGHLAPIFSHPALVPMLITFR